MLVIELGDVHRERAQDRRPGRRVVRARRVRRLGILALGLFADGRYGDGCNGVAGKVRGLLYGDPAQFVAECIGIVVCVLWVGTMAFLTMRLAGALVRQPRDGGGRARRAGRPRDGHRGLHDRTDARVTFRKGDINVPVQAKGQWMTSTTRIGTAPGYSRDGRSALRARLAGVGLWDLVQMECLAGLARLHADHGRGRALVTCTSRAGT